MNPNESAPAVKAKPKSPYYLGYYAAVRYGGRNPFSAEDEPEKHEDWNQGYDDGSEESQDRDQECRCDH